MYYADIHSPGQQLLISKKTNKYSKVQERPAKIQNFNFSCVRLAPSHFVSFPSPFSDTTTMASAATAPPATSASKKEEGKVVKPKLKRKLEVAEIVSPKGVPKILKDLSGVKFSGDNRVRTLFVKRMI